MEQARLSHCKWINGIIVYEINGGWSGAARTQRYEEAWSEDSRAGRDASTCVLLLRS